MTFHLPSVFLVNIVRVLITKLHPKSAAPPPLAIKKAVRATLILIPLFGLQHVLIPFRPQKGSSFESVYHIVSAVIISLQGLCVSCLFCFANHEVITAVLSYLNSILPTLFKTSSRESYNNLGPGTTTRDIVL
jgi:calcitonin receptor-like